MKHTVLEIKEYVVESSSEQDAIEMVKQDKTFSAEHTNTYYAVRPTVEPPEVTTYVVARERVQPVLDVKRIPQKKGW